MDRQMISSAVPAHIAERISDVPMSIAEEREQERQRQKRIIDATDAILEGDGLHTWARDDYAYELVDLVHHLDKTGASSEDAWLAIKDWRHDLAERQAKYEIEINP